MLWQTFSIAIVTSTCWRKLTSFKVLFIPSELILSANKPQEDEKNQVHTLVKHYLTLSPHPFLICPLRGFLRKAENAICPRDDYTVRVAVKLQLTFLSRFMSWYQSAQAAITKYHTLSGLETEMDFLTVLEAGNPRSRCWKFWFLVRTVFLSCRWSPSGCVLVWWRERVLVSFPLLIRTSVLLN